MARLNRSNLLTIFLLIASLTVQSQGLLNYREVSKASLVNDPRLAYLFDIDNDSDLDIIALSDDDQKVVIFINQGNELFEELVLSLNFPAIFFRISDLDQDGDFDLVFSDLGKKIMWGENAGSLSFSFKSLYIGWGPNSFDIQDIDGNGTEDILGISTSGTKVAWLKNDDQRFSLHEISRTPFVPTWIEIADLDDDGHYDAVVSDSYYDVMYLFQGDGEGEFSESEITTTSSYIGHLKVSDIDSDGKKDIITASQSDGKITVFKNMGDLLFDEVLITQQLSQPVFIDIVDIDNDTDKDIITIDQHSNRIILLKNNEQLTFSQDILPSTIKHPYRVMFGDINNDQKMDFFTSSLGDNQISWYKNIDNLIFSQETLTKSEMTHPEAAHIIDIDKDGINDIIGGISPQNEVLFFIQDENRNFTTHKISSPYGTLSGTSVADLDNDNDYDLVVIQRHQNRIIVLEQISNDNFRTRSISSSGRGISIPNLVDLDEDGLTDLCLTATNNNSVIWYKNLGNLSFNEFVIDSDTPGASENKVIDLDGDGDNDILVVQSHYPGGIYWLKNDGNEVFTKEVINANIRIPSSIAYADLDNDDDIDVLTTDNSSDELYWYQNDGTENFTEITISSAADFTQNIVTTDFDKDGHTDIFISRLFEKNPLYFKNNGNGNFTQTSLSNFYGTTFINTGDIDSDGDQDLVVSTSGKDGIIIIEQIGCNSGNEELVQFNGSPYQNIIKEGEYHFRQKLLSKGKILNGMVTLKAGDEILLDKGFIVKMGGLLEVKIESCE